ncbi:rCG60882 [Rattus norvegicus]|uniref:RCG60882 n=1 Tax=Rattus norvegicus TaxID=10116 RepID=A6JJG9_RAT|nr:rCG60882 [Rattus norvegicus]
MRPETLEKHRQQGSPGPAQPAWVPFTLSSVGSDSVLSVSSTRWRHWTRMGRFSTILNRALFIGWWSTVV